MGLFVITNRSPNHDWTAIWLSFGENLLYHTKIMPAMGQSIGVIFIKHFLVGKYGGLPFIFLVNMWNCKFHYILYILFCHIRFGAFSHISEGQIHFKFDEFFVDPCHSCLATSFYNHKLYYTVKGLTFHCKNFKIHGVPNEWWHYEK